MLDLSTMAFRFPILVTFLVVFIGGIRQSLDDNLDFSSHENLIAKNNPVDQISVRESTVDLQISVGDKIFVFGKAGGTLEKVKVGMHVLPFSQVPGSPGKESTLTKVSWKKLKDGSIQIQSSYIPWPATLTWTVLESGELKMEASASPQEIMEDGWLGLGFNYPEHQLFQVTWIGNSGPHPDPNGLWKNENFVPLENFGQKTESEQAGVFRQIKTVKLEFESVRVDVRTDNPDVYFGMGKPEYQGSDFPDLNSDLGFLVNQTGDKIIPSSKSNPEISQSKHTVSLNPLVLWFHFQ